jgi:hypothetical protein
MFSMFTKEFAMDMAERAAMTFAQAFLAVYTVGDMASAKAAGVAGTAAVLAMLKAVAATKVKSNSASLVA